MNTTTVLVWLIVAALVILIIFRFLKKRNDKADNKAVNTETQAVWPFWIVILFLLLIIGVQHFGLPGGQGEQKMKVQQVESMPAITPDELTNIVGKDEDYIAEIFVSKKFKRTRSATQYTYTLHNPNEKHENDPEKKIFE